MSVEDQFTIWGWAQATFGVPTPARAALRALEEMVELCVECGCGTTDIGPVVASAVASAEKKSKGLAAAPEELADVTIVLAQLAGALNHAPGLSRPVIISDEVARKMRINRNRTWKLDGQGSGQHVESQHEAI